ncbi:MAG: aspartate dehydrogenase, partial [Burkholderiaceae bacterium]
MTKNNRPLLTVGIFGLGTIGREVALALDAGIDGLRLTAVAAGNSERAAQFCAGLTTDVTVTDAAGMAAICDVVMECAPAAVFGEIANACIDNGCVFMPLSVGGLLRHPDLAERAKQSGARIVVPTGALLGLDAVRAAAEGTIHSARIVTRKPPRGLAGAPYLEKHGIDVSALTEPLKVFEGSARDGVAGFPANVNVSAALSLAGIGPDRTELQIWADPGVDRNKHRIEIEADSARFTMEIENVPTESNPATGKITALSAIACLRGFAGTFRV